MCACICHEEIEVPKPAELLMEFLDRSYPHGHEKFNDLMLQQIEMHSNKNAHYAGGGQALGNFDRMAYLMTLYPNFPVATSAGMAVMYMLKHFDAIMWAMCQGKTPPDDSLGDLPVYATIMRCMANA